MLCCVWVHVSHVCLGFCLTDDPQQEKQDSFMEKLVTQVIKNLQVKIANIHVRYEDNVSIQVLSRTWNKKIYTFLILVHS